MKTTLLLSTLLIGCLSSFAVGQSTSGDIVVNNTYISHNDEFDREIPAQVAGLLLVMNVHEGDSVKKGAPLAQLDTTEAEMRQNVAQFRKEKAEEEASNTIRAEFAIAQYDVSQQEYKNAWDANKRAQKFIFSAGEVRQLKLQATQSKLQITNEKFNTKLAELEVKVQNAEVQAADEAIKRHKIVAPFDGQIAKIYRKADEWAQAGEPILKIVQYDYMIVTGFVNASDFNPHELENLKVTVVVPLARGKTLTLPGKITYVGSDSAAGGYDRFEVRARVANRRLGGKADGRWIISDGVRVQMTAHPE